MTNSRLQAQLVEDHLRKAVRLPSTFSARVPLPGGRCPVPGRPLRGWPLCACCQAGLAALRPFSSYFVPVSLLCALRGGRLKPVRAPKTNKFACDPMVGPIWLSRCGCPSRSPGHSTAMPPTRWCVTPWLVQSECFRGLEVLAFLIHHSGGSALLLLVRVHTERGSWVFLLNT